MKESRPQNRMGNIVFKEISVLIKPFVDNRKFHIDRWVTFEEL